MAFLHYFFLLKIIDDQYAFKNRRRFYDPTNSSAKNREDSPEARKDLERVDDDNAEAVRAKEREETRKKKQKYLYEKKMTESYGINEGEVDYIKLSGKPSPGL